MAWIRTVAPSEATGLLKKVYDAAIGRAGQVFHVLRLMSLNPSVLQSSMKLYLDLLHGRSALSRAQREMIATVVSRTNGCYY